MKRRMVHITHPKFGESDVMPSSLPIWRERGWRTEEDAAPAAAPLSTPSVLPDVAESDVTASRNLKKTKQQAEES